MYPDQARLAGIQGTVVLEILVDESGIPTQISVLSPLGYGLDEAAIAAVSQWRYAPTRIDGKPVGVYTEITVNFSLDNVSFDRKAEKQRTAFNVALRAVQQGKITQRTIDSARNLSSQKYGPGLYLYGRLLEEGRSVPADPAEGFRLIQESADKQYGPALYDVALARLKGDRLDKDPAKGLDLMRSAAKFGSRSAQWYLGQAYEAGDGVSVDFEKSREYLRLCASAGDANCQFRLGRSLLQHSDRPDRDYVQAIAWLELASDQKVEDAEKILEKEDERLTPAQAAGASRLKAQLVHKP